VGFIDDGVLRRDQTTALLFEQIRELLGVGVGWQLRSPILRRFPLAR